MREVYLAENLGFCYGVKRAIQLAEDSVSPQSRSYTLGPIIHNPQMVARLAEEGIGKIETLDEIAEGTVNQLRISAEKMNVTLTTDVKPGLVSADKGMMEELKRVAIESVLACEEQKISDWSAIKSRVKNNISGYLYKTTRRSPMILPVITEV